MKYLPYNFSTGVSFVTILSVVAMMQGCNPQNCTTLVVSPPKPTIRIDQTDTDTRSTIYVYYVDHDKEADQNGYVGKPYVHLSNIEEVLAYKKQAEFLLKALDEAERKMTIHEDGPKTTSP